MKRPRERWVWTSCFAALTGSLYARLQNYVNGTFFDLGVTVRLMVIHVVGGIATLRGPVIGAVLLI